MRSPLCSRRSARLEAEDAFTLIEVLVAVLILTVGLLGLIGAFDSARKLTLLSERRTSMAHRAQLEIERLQAVPYSELLMTSTPPHASETTNPDYYVKEGSPPEYQYGTSSSEAEHLAIASLECTTLKTSCGVISSAPTGRECSNYDGACEWKDGLLKGTVYDFITWHPDSCGESATCKPTEAYKRITVAVTLKVPGGSRPVPAVRVSTLVAGPGT
jgi:prepilin-type N-terminal cleavage/methylation domain-containing protein